MHYSHSVTHATLNEQHSGGPPTHLFEINMALL